MASRVALISSTKRPYKYKRSSYIRIMIQWIALTSIVHLLDTHVLASEKGVGIDAVEEQVLALLSGRPMDELVKDVERALSRCLHAKQVR